MQSLYVEITKETKVKPEPIHLGFRLGVHYLIDYIEKLRSIGVNHLTLNLRFNTMNMDATLERIAKRVLPEFHTKKNNKKM